MTRNFTGRHMLALMLAFFGTIVAVNVTMATLATRTFGGTVVDNSYVASQRFNGWLAEARAQQAIGWTATIEVAADRRIDAVIRGEDGPVDQAQVAAVAVHPVGREEDVPLRFEPIGEGVYRSMEALPAGRWSIRMTVERGADRVRLIETVQ